MVLSNCCAMQIAESLVGCNLPLTDIAQQLAHLYYTSCPETQVQETSIRNCILELAARKSFAPQSSKTQLAETIL